MSVWLLAFLLAATAAPPAPAAKGCMVQYTTESRYRGFGYEHIVHVENGCDVAVACEVHASHARRDVAVPAQRRRSVVVRQGSPAREFSAAVYCKPKR